MQVSAAGAFSSELYSKTQKSVCDLGHGGQYREYVRLWGVLWCDGRPRPSRARET